MRWRGFPVERKGDCVAIAPDYSPGTETARFLWQVCKVCARHQPAAVALRFGHVPTSRKGWGHRPDFTDHAGKLRWPCSSSISSMPRSCASINHHVGAVWAHRHGGTPFGQLGAHFFESSSSVSHGTQVTMSATIPGGCKVHKIALGGRRSPRRRSPAGMPQFANLSGRTDNDTARTLPAARFQTPYLLSQGRRGVVADLFRAIGVAAPALQGLAHQRLEGERRSALTGWRRARAASAIMPMTATTAPRPPEQSTGTERCGAQAQRGLAARARPAAKLPARHPRALWAPAAGAAAGVAGLAGLRCSAVAFCVGHLRRIRWVTLLDLTVCPRIYCHPCLAWRPHGYRHQRDQTQTIVFHVISDLCHSSGDPAVQHLMPTCRRQRRPSGLVVHMPKTICCSMSVFSSSWTVVHPDGFRQIAVTGHRPPPVCPAGAVR